MELNLHAVSASGRVAFGDLLKGVKFVQVSKAADGALTLEPVVIKAATGQTGDTGDTGYVEDGEDLGDVSL